MDNYNGKSLNGIEQLDKAPKKPINPKLIFFKYFRFWPWIIVSIVLFQIGAFAYLRYTTPQYQVSSTIMIKGDKDSEGLAQSQIMAELGIVDNELDVRKELLILKSKDLMTKIIMRLGFDVSYFAQGKIQKSELYQSPLKAVTYELNREAYSHTFEIKVLEENKFEFSDGVDVSIQSFGSEFELPKYGRFSFGYTPSAIIDQKDYLIKFSKPSSLGRRYSNALNIQNVAGNREVLRLSITDPVPRKARDILEVLVDEYDKAGVAERSKVFNNQLFFIEERLTEMTDQLSTVEENAERIRLNADGIMDNPEAGPSDVMNEIAEYERRIVEIDLQMRIISSLKDSLLQRSFPFLFFPPTLKIADDFTLPNLIQQYNELVGQRNRLLLSAKKRNPAVEQYELQIENLKQTLLANIDIFNQNLQDTKDRLEEYSKRLQGRLRSLPAKKRRFLALQREQDIKEVILNFLLQKREETLLSIATAVPTTRVLEPAAFSNTPVSPQKMAAYLIAFVAGLALPIAIILLLEVLNDKVRSEQDIQEETQTPFLGGISYDKTDDPIVVKPLSRSSIAEMFPLTEN